MDNGIKGAIFDLDGTLLDSLWVWADIDARFLAKRGFAVPPDYMAKVCTLSYRETAEYTIARFGLTDTPEQLMAEWLEMSVAYYADELKLKPAVKQYLRELKAKGIKLAVATSALPEMCIPALKNNGVYDLFDAVVTTSEVGRGKTSPDVYLLAAKRIGLAPSQCAVYEDSLGAARTAKAAEFYIVGVYDRYGEAQADELKLFADEFIDFSA